MLYNRNFLNNSVILSDKQKEELEFLANEFCISVESAHRALDDARVCMEVFQHNLAHIKD